MDTNDCETIVSVLNETIRQIDRDNKLLNSISEDMISIQRKQLSATHIQNYLNAIKIYHKLCKK